MERERKIKEENEAIRFYHASNKRLRRGAMLIPGRGTWFEEVQTYGIFLTTSHECQRLNLQPLVMETHVCLPYFLYA